MAFVAVGLAAGCASIPGPWGSQRGAADAAADTRGPSAAPTAANAPGSTAGGGPNAPSAAQTAHAAGQSGGDGAHTGRATADANAADPQPPAASTESVPEYVQQLDALVQRGAVPAAERDKWHRALQEAEPRVRSYILALLAARAEDPYLTGRGLAAPGVQGANPPEGPGSDGPSDRPPGSDGRDRAAGDPPRIAAQPAAAAMAAAGPAGAGAALLPPSGIGSLDQAEAELRAMRQRLQRGIKAAAAVETPQPGQPVVPMWASSQGSSQPPAARSDAASQPWTPPEAVAALSVPTEPPGGGEPSWLGAARGALQQKMARAADAEERRRCEIQLRLLLLAAGQRDEALRPIDGLSLAEQAYWRDQLYALDTLLRRDEFPSGARRAAAAAQHLQQAMYRLADDAGLVLRRVAFCRAVESYGVIQPFDKDAFRPGETVLLYVEVDHFTTQHTPQGHHAAFAADYQIFDSGRHRVVQESLPEIEEYCGNRRRDFFMSYRVRLPQSISAGRYTLLLNVTDTLGQKAASAAVDFEIQ